MITITPEGGLCNRMRALDSALFLSQDTRMKLHVIWLLNEKLNCRFDELFEVPSGIKWITHIKEYTKIGYGVWDFYQKYMHKAYGLIINQDKILQSDVQNMLSRRERDIQLDSFRNIFIMTYSRFYGSPPFYKAFKPVPILQKEIDYICKSLLNATGIHIRRTDNRKSIESSPTWKFIELMEEEIKKEKDIIFFVATDSPEEEARLKDIFPGRIVSHTKSSLDRNNPAAIRDALVDLYCLSRCKKIIGSYWSSFSETASEIGKAELMTITI